MPLPEKIKNAPELEIGLGLFYEGFLDLTSCRSVGTSLGPIPYLQIYEYCLIHDITGELAEDFLWLIPRLDGKYLTWAAEKK